MFAKIKAEQLFAFSNKDNATRNMLRAYNICSISLETLR